MKHIYFVSNNLISKARIVYPKTTTFVEVRGKTMLSKKGLDAAYSLNQLECLQDIEVIYSSPYFCALETAKSVAEEKDLDVVVDERLRERIIGDLGSNEYRFLKGMQEHDFDYKLPNGESLNDVKKRMEEFFKSILQEVENEIMVVTHNTALLSLALRWCNKGYNLDDRLILDYEDEVIFDGTYNAMDVIEITMEDNKFAGIKRIK